MELSTSPSQHRPVPNEAFDFRQLDEVGESKLNIAGLVLVVHYCTRVSRSFLSVTDLLSWRNWEQTLTNQ